MIRIEPAAATAAALLLAACAHDTTASAPRGERASVNSYATTSTANGIVETGPTSPNVVDNKTTSPLTGSVTGSIQPSPSAMGTTTTSGSLAGTTSTGSVSDSTRSPAVNDTASSSSLGNGASTTPSTNTQPGGMR
jgi:hypothetical protein